MRPDITNNNSDFKFRTNKKHRPAQVRDVLRHRDKGWDAGTIVGWTGLKLSVVKEILAENTEKKSDKK